MESPWEIFQRHNLSSFERNRAFLNVGGRNFLDISHISGADTDGDSRSAITVDFNHDGRLDLVLRQAGSQPIVLYESRFPQRHFLQVTLRGRAGNRLALGSRLMAFVGEQQIVRELYPLNSFRSQQPLAVHFGLGEAERVDKVVVLWPSGRKQTFSGLPANRHVVLTEGSERIEIVEPGRPVEP